MTRLGGPPCRWWVPALAMAFASLTGVAGGSIPEDPVSPGSELWASRYNGPGNGEDFACCLAVSPDGSKVFVTGASASSGSYHDYATVAYDAGSGAQLWVTRYNGGAARALAVSPDGSKVYVTGTSTLSGSVDYGTVAYDAGSGAHLWASRYNGPRNAYDEAQSLAVSPDGSKVFVTGHSDGTNGYNDYATVAYDAGSGAQLWVTRYDETGESDTANSLGVSPDGSTVFVTGSSWDSTSYHDYATVAYDAGSGAQLWVTRYNRPGNSNDFATSLRVSPDGSKVFVTGTSAYSSGWDYATVAYDAGSGSQLWVVRYDETGNSDDHANSLGVSPDGSTVFVTGASRGSNGYEYATVAYDAGSGSQLWVTRYSDLGNADDVARSSLAVSPDGSNVLVTGSWGSDSIYDYATVAYDAGSGAQLWVARRSGPGKADPFARSPAVSPDGSRVFVTGHSGGSGGDRDYMTVAYRVTACASGKYESGPASGPVHDQLEPFAGDASAPYVHGVNCDLIAANGL